MALNDFLSVLGYKKTTSATSYPSYLPQDPRTQSSGSSQASSSQPSQSYATIDELRQSTGTANTVPTTRTTTAKTTTPTTQATAPTATATPELTREQQLQIDADMMGLKGQARQVFIEEHMGLLPKVASTTSYKESAQADKMSGVTSSDPVKDGVNDISSTIDSKISDATKSIVATDVGLEMPSDADYKALYDAKLSGNNQEYNALVEEIKAKYAGSRQTQDIINRQATGTVSSFLGRAGSFSSAGGQSMSINQELANNAEMNRLANEEISALSKAKNAKDANDLAALESYLAQADRLREERNSIRLKNLDISLAAEDRLSEKKKQEQADAEREAGYLGNLSSEDFSKVDPTYIAKIESTLNMPTGYLKSLSDAQAALSVASSEKDKMDRSIELFKLAKDLPNGMEYSFADGTKITGFSKADGKVMQVTTSDGGVAFVTIDPTTGDVLGNVTLPNLISDVKASRAFGGGGSSRGGDSIFPDTFDQQDMLILQSAKDSVGLTIQEAYNSLSQKLGTEIPIPSGVDPSSIFTKDDAFLQATYLSDNIAASSGDAYALLEQDFTLRDVDIGDGTKALVAVDTTTGKSQWVDLGETTTAKTESGGGFLDWLSKAWNGANSEVTS